MKKLVLIFLLVSFHLAWSQNKTKTIAGNSQTQNLVSTLKHDTCLNRKFSIVFYVFLDSSYTPGMATPAYINVFMDTLNSKFKRLCVRFENCSTVYIPNHSYGEWNVPAVEPVVTAQWYTDKTMNIYLVDSIYQNWPSEALGYSYGPPTNSNTPTKDIIVLEKWHLNMNGGTISLHHIGHFFGLRHTHDEINPTLPTTPPPPANVASKEFVDRTNCELHGDGLCDTEADPLGSAPQDGKGEFYLPPNDNYMSFSDNGCRFTQQQYNRMAYIMITSRKYLH